VASGVVTVAGEVSATTLDIGGTNITSTAAELNILDGVTASTSEINILDGVTASTSELNIMDGVTATTSELNILDGVTASATELNLLDGVSGLEQADFTKLAAVTSSAAELNVLDGYTGSVTELNYLDTLHATGVTSSEFDFLDGVTSNIQTQLNTKVTSSGVTQVTGGTGLNGTVTSTGSLNLNTGIGDVGTYAFLARQADTTIVAGQTYTNSSSGADNNNANLVYSGLQMDAGQNFDDDTALDATGSSVTTGLTGIWRAMGEANNVNRRSGTLFLRIS
jgi:hypothetical protein